MYKCTLQTGVLEQSAEKKSPLLAHITHVTQVHLISMWPGSPNP